MQRISTTIAMTMLLGAGCAELEPGQTTDLTRSSLVAGEAASTEATPCPVPGSLAYHLTQGPGKKHFRYDPQGALVEEVRGRFRERQGLFRWVETFHPDHERVRREVSGEVSFAGDTRELRYLVSTEDVAGQVKSLEVEESWAGCQVDRRSRPAGSTDSAWLGHQGSYDGTTYAYVEEQAPYTYAGAARIEVAGTVYADGSWVESYEGEPWYIYYSQTRSGDADGYLRVDWLQDYGDGIFYGTDEYFIDGTQHRFEHSGSDGDCPSTFDDYTIDRNGHGSGTATRCVIEGEGDDEWPTLTSCTVAITPEGCTQSCENGGTYTCSLGRRGN